MAWTDERVELLRRRWGEGQSASEIAKELGGVTRNAVIGKAHRLGLSKATSLVGTKKKPDAPDKSKPAQKESGPQPVESETNPVTASASEAKPPLLPKIVSADKPLPPQPSANEISPEALASHRDVLKNSPRLGLMELTEKTCKWPIGDPATDDFWFCGLPVERGKHYCEPCAKVAYQPALAKRARRR